MRTLNRVMLLGSVGRDPELKSTSGGTLVANLSLATSERRKDSAGAWQDDTSWHNLVAFGRTAEVVRDYVTKGAALHIEGRLQYRTWEKDGQKHYWTEIVVENLILLNAKSRETAARTAEPREIEDSDIPF